MGLIKCPDCGKEVSDMAINCPYCGRPLNSDNVSANASNANGAESTRKKKKGHGCLVSIIGFCIIVAIICVAVNSSSDKSSKKQTTQENEDKNSEIQFSQTGQITEELTLVVNEVSEADSISVANGLGSYKPDSGKYAIVNVTIANVSKKSQSLLLNYFKLIGPDDAEYSSSLVVVADDKFISVDTINPNLDITGNLLFEIPQDVSAKDCILQYRDYDFKNGKIYFKLK